MDRQKLINQLVIDEGKRNKPYVDTVGKTTIGVGRNLTDRGIADDEVVFLLGNDIDLITRELDARLPWWRGMCDARQNVLANMAFNMGMSSLLTFKNTLACMQTAKYAEAADGMLASKWAKQVGARADRLAKIMREGT